MIASLPSGAGDAGGVGSGGVLSYFGVLAYAELGAMMPDTGGQYVYLREAFGPGCAFLSGWIFMLAVMPGSMSFLAVGFSIYLAQFVPLSPAMREIVSLALLFVLTAANYIGVREGAWIQRIFTSLKIAGLLLFIGAAAFAPALRSLTVAAQLAGRLAARQFPIAGSAYALSACLMAYNGWSYVSFVAGEIRNPKRNLPRALALGMAALWRCMWPPTSPTCT